MNGDESIKDLAAAMDETLNKIKTHFETSSSEILAKMEQLSARMENMEKTVTEMMYTDTNTAELDDQEEEKSQ